MGVDVLQGRFGAAGRDCLAMQCVGFEVDCGLEQRTSHLLHLVDDGLGCGGHGPEVRRLSDMLDQVLAILHHLPYDHRTLHEGSSR
jgi:hypothetical protein